MAPRAHQNNQPTRVTASRTSFGMFVRAANRMAYACASLTVNPKSQMSDSSFGIASWTVVIGLLSCDPHDSDEA